MTKSMSFDTLMYKSRKQRKLPSEDEVVLAFDPGHTTGYALFCGPFFMECDELDTDDMEKATKHIFAIIEEYVPDMIVVEDYRVYRWRQKQHVGSEMLTTRVIGCIETACALKSIPLFKQPAHIAKSFCTDKKLKAWDFYQPGLKHARDAIRHACYFLLFGPIKGKDKPKLTVG